MSRIPHTQPTDLSWVIIPIASSASRAQRPRQESDHRQALCQWWSPKSAQYPSQGAPNYAFKAEVTAQHILPGKNEHETRNIYDDPIKHYIKSPLLLKARGLFSPALPLPESFNANKLSQRFAADSPQWEEGFYKAEAAQLQQTCCRSSTQYEVSLILFLPQKCGNTPFGKFLPPAQLQAFSLKLCR